MTTLHLPDLPYYEFEEVASLLECEIEDVEHLVFVERTIRPAIVSKHFPEFYFRPEGWEVAHELIGEYTDDLYDSGFPPWLYVNLNQIQNYVITANSGTKPTRFSIITRGDRLGICHFEDELNVRISLSRRDDTGELEDQYLEFNASDFVITHDELFFNRLVGNQPKVQANSKTASGKQVGNLQRLAGALAIALKHANQDFSTSDGKVCLKTLADRISSALQDPSLLTNDWVMKTLEKSLFLVDEVE